MKFADAAALTIHEVKNALAQLAVQAGVRGDQESEQVCLGAAAALTRLLMLYRSETGQLELRVDAGSPADLADELVQGVRSLRDLDWTLETAEAPTLAFYDVGLVRLVLGTALDNALRHAHRGVRFSVCSEGAWVVFRIADDGPGFPPALLQGDEPVPASRQGTGLGLYLARLVARAHEHEGRRGDVVLTNDGGACFALRLPA